MIAAVGALQSETWSTCSVRRPMLYDVIVCLSHWHDNCLVWPGDEGCRAQLEPDLKPDLLSACGRVGQKVRGGSDELSNM